jgi:hypothetical protein
MEFKLKKSRLQKFINFGILPENLEELTEQQREILEDICISKNSFDSLLSKYINHADTYGKQKYIHRKLMQKKTFRNHVMVDTNIRPEDIIVNEFCPFFGTKLDYRTLPISKITKHMYSIDRIDNSKMYTKGNVWVISRLANIIKNESTLSELKTFSSNVIKQILKNKNLIS